MFVLGCVGNFVALRAFRNTGSNSSRLLTTGIEKSALTAPMFSSSRSLQVGVFRFHRSERHDECHISVRILNPAGARKKLLRVHIGHYLVLLSVRVDISGVVRLRFRIRVRVIVGLGLGLGLVSC